MTCKECGSTNVRFEDYGEAPYSKCQDCGACFG